MKGIFKSKPLTTDELVCWVKNPTINPRTHKIIKIGGKTHSEINFYYLKNKDKIDNLINGNLDNLLKCCDDRDPISMNLFWIESKNDKTKQCVYPIDQLSQIKKVEAPNALFGKIQARLENLKSENFSTGIFTKTIVIILQTT